MELPLRTLFESPTVAHLATHVEAALASQVNPSELERMLADLDDGREIP